jgi:hypothetical protein
MDPPDVSGAMARVGSWRRKKADGADLFPLLKTHDHPDPRRGGNRPPAGRIALGQEVPYSHRWVSQEDVMATNKPVGDNARKGAVKKRSQLTTKTMGKKTFTKRNTVGGQFMAQKKTSKFKGVRKER